MFASREANAFITGLATPSDRQREVLLESLISPNVESEFGQRHNFAKIRSIEDYQRAVPIRKYGGFDPWIQRIVHGEQGILTSEPVKRFFMTSGSTSKAKYIPVTSTFVRTKSRAFGIYWDRVFADHPEAKSGRMITNFSDSGEPVRAPCGLPCSSESAYWAGITRATQLQTRAIIPKSVAQIGDSNARYYTIARILLEESFSVIMTLNPSTILLLFKKLGEFSAELIEDIENGGLSDQIEVADIVRDTIRATYPGNRERAARLRELSAGAGNLLAHELWPDLSLAICWRSPMLRPYIDLLAPHFGDRVAGRDYMMMASEGIMGIPLQDGTSGGVCAVGLHFYEFIPEDEVDLENPTVLLPEQVEVGKNYVLILSNGSGLYRYNIGDVVRIVRFEQATPVIEFLHRAGRTCSLTGEKLTEDQVTGAIDDVARELGLAIEGFTLAPAKGGFPRYVAMVELAAEAPAETLGRFPQLLDEALERHNIEYGSKRSSQRLAAPELWVARPGSFEGLRRQRTASGASDSQIKPMHLTRDAGFADQLEFDEKHV